MTRLAGMLMSAVPLAGGVSALAEVANNGFAPPLQPDPARDDAIRAMLPLVPELGWTVRALRQAAGPDADLLFPGGPAEMVETHSAIADARMAASADPAAEARLSRRVRALLLARLDQAEPDREAVRRGLSLLSLPGNRPAAARSLLRTVDMVWRAAGDTATGFSWYSKRVLLAGVYSATLLYWLRRGGGPETEAFLDRRLAGVARIGSLGRRLRSAR